MSRKEKNVKGKQVQKIKILNRKEKNVKGKQIQRIEILNRKEKNVKRKLIQRIEKVKKKVGLKMVNVKNYLELEKSNLINYTKDPSTIFPAIVLNMFDDCQVDEQKKHDLKK